MKLKLSRKAMRKSFGYRQPMRWGGFGPSFKKFVKGNSPK